MKKQHLTRNFSQTQALGRSLAKNILQTKGRTRALVLALQGDLGGGKTTFLQGFAKGLGIKRKVISPTFVIMKRFPFRGKSFSDFYHFDCYRIGRQKEMADLDFKSIIADPRHIVAVEWADKIKKILPKDVLVIKFDFVDDHKRKITVASNNDRR